MSRYIFPGADASVPLSSMMRAAENARFEISDVERFTAHYALTIRAWRSNWVDNRMAVVAKYGERWFRLWNFFLQWSAVIAEQGTGLTCCGSKCSILTSYPTQIACKNKTPATP